MGGAVFSEGRDRPVVKELAMKGLAMNSLAMKSSTMKHLKCISFGLVLLCTSALFAQSAPASPPASRSAAPFIDPRWGTPRKDLLAAYTDYIHGATRDDRGEGVFNVRMHALLDAVDEIHKAQASMIAQPGAVYRDLFAKNAVMCQRTAILFWQATARVDTTPGHFYQPPSPEVVGCMKTLAQPDPEHF